MRSPKNYLGFLTRKRESPEFTKRQFVFKAVQIYLCYLGFDFAGSHIYSLETQYAYGKITAYQAFYAPNVLYYYFITGFCLANGLWKLFEIYWWGKDRVKRLSLDCDGEVITFHKSIDKTMKTSSEVN